MPTSSLLGIAKLNTTSHHSQCDGMVERLNRTLKNIFQKHAATFWSQWDRYLLGTLWAYRNVPHDATNVKPSFLLMGMDCRMPTEAALFPLQEMEPVEVSDYREEIILSLSTARKLAAESIRTAQAQYKRMYDKYSREANYQLGDWVLVHFPQKETGKWRKLSRPWHSTYRIIGRRYPDVTVIKVYAPPRWQAPCPSSRVVPCPPELPAGFFWYGTRRAGPGRPPKWVVGLLAGQLPASAASGEGLRVLLVRLLHLLWTGQSGTTQGDDDSIEQESIVDGLNAMPEPDELTQSPDRELQPHAQEAVSGALTEDPSQERR